MIIKSWRQDSSEGLWGSRKSFFLKLFIQGLLSGSAVEPKADAQWLSHPVQCHKVSVLGFLHKSFVLGFTFRSLIH